MERSSIFLRMALLLCMAIPIHRGLLRADTGNSEAAATGFAGDTQRKIGSCDNECVQYLYINANIGVSSGGHSALRIGSRVYHFQLHPDGIFHLERDEWDDFRYDYGILQNRTIHFRKLRLSSADAKRIRDSFDLRFLEQRQRLRNLQDLREQLSMLRDIEDGRTRVRVKGAGIFAKEGISPSMDLLSRALAKELSVDFLDRLREIDERLHAFEIEAYSGGSFARHSDGQRVILEFPGDAALFRESLVALLQKRLALQILLGRRPLLSGAYQAPLCSVERRPSCRGTQFLGSFRRQLLRLADPYNPGILTLHDRNVQEKLKRYLQSRIAHLLDSEDPGAGLALLLALGRYEAVSMSLRSGCLHLLLPGSASPFAADPPSDGGEASDVHLPPQGVMESFLEESRIHFGETISSVLGKEDVPDEMALLRLERAAARYSLLEKGIRKNRWRGLAVDAIPDRPGEVELPETLLNVIRTRRELMPSTRGELRLYRGAMQTIYPYALIRSNCTTELFRVMNAAIVGDAGPVRIQPKKGWNGQDKSVGFSFFVDPDSDLHFIPFVAFRAVGRAFPVVETGAYPSYRRIMLDRMSRREGPIPLFFRESNTLTSRIYHKNETDAWFLFFTDEPVWPRPLFGLFNLGAGIGETLYGVGKAPFDRGDELVKGMRGIIFSGPELLFMNVRKGRFDRVSRSILLESEAKPLRE